MNDSVGTLVAGEGQTSNPGTDGEKSGGATLADIFRSLVKNKWLILACIAVFVAVAVVYIAVSKPVYEASATIRIDPSRSGSLGLNDLLSLVGSEGSGEETQTEMSILKSDKVALDTLNSLTPEQFRKYAGFDREPDMGNNDVRQLSQREEQLLVQFGKALTTKQVEGTQLIAIHFRTGNPQVGAVIVNNLIDAYEHGNFDSRYQSVSQVKTWLQKQMDDLREKASAAQKQLAQFQEKNNLVGTDPSNNTTIDRLKLLNTQLTEAEGDRIVKEAQLRAAETGDPAVLSSLMPDPKLQSLQQQEGTLYGQYVQLSTKFGPGYPPLADVKKQLATVKAEIQQDVQVVSARLKEDYTASSGAEGMLRGQYEDEIKKAFALNRTQADYAVLLAEATSSRDLFDTLQYKLQQAAVDAGLNSVNTMIVDRARPPIEPVLPMKMLTLAFAVLLGGATGVGAALLRESLSDQIQSVADIENGTGLVCMSVVPHLELLQTAVVGASESGEETIARRIISISDPRSRGAEAYRSLRNAILLSSIDRPARVVAVTSSLPGEGKSSTSVNYSVVLAQKGGRILLVDSDLRRPTLHTYFGLQKGIGLSDAIIEGKEKNGIVSPIPELPNLDFLSAGRNITLPSEALGSAKFRSMLQEWEKEYDTVILDCAPILSVSDSVPVASWADTVVIIARAGVTPLRALQRSKSILVRAHAHLAGVLLNDFSNRIGDYDYYGRYDDGYYN
jgi:polysaccharide biosynthesis transport protein